MKFLFAILLFFPMISWAQSEADVWIDFNNGSGEYVAKYLLADSVILRKSSDKASTAVAVLRIGEKLEVLDRAQFETIKGISSHWYKVKTMNYKGWIWGGFIAKHAFGSEADPSIKFVAGCDWVEKSPEGHDIFKYQIRAFRNQEQLAKISINAFGNKHLYDVKSLGSKGRCGCTTGDIIVFWSGNQFYHVANLLGTADAWASSSTQFIYPTDMEGIPGQVIQFSNEYLDMQEEGNNQIQTKRRLTKKYFIWKHHQLVPAEKDKEVKYVSVNY